MLPDFDYHRVRSIPEAVQILAAYRSEARILAGGTDLLLQIERGKIRPRHLVSLREITALKYLRPEGGAIRLGANTTHRDLELSPFIKNELGALHDAVRQLGSVQIRNAATVAGNICNAAPSADTAAPLLALGAEVKVVGPRDERIIPLKHFFQGPGRTVLEPDEVLLEISIPRPPAFAASAYLKLARRKAMDLALIGAAVYVHCSSDKSRFEEVRIALSTVAPTPIRAYTAENMLKGAAISERALQEAADLAAMETSPRTSWRSMAEYRREMVRVFVRRALLNALERIQC